MSFAKEVEGIYRLKVPFDDLYKLYERRIKK